jgi:hypothetical protein
VFISDERPHAVASELLKRSGTLCSELKARPAQKSCRRAVRLASYYNDLRGEVRPWRVWFPDEDRLVPGRAWCLPWTLRGGGLLTGAQSGLLLLAVLVVALLLVALFNSLREQTPFIEAIPTGIIGLLVVLIVLVILGVLLVSATKWLQARGLLQGKEIWWWWTASEDEVAVRAQELHNFLEHWAEGSAPEPASEKDDKELPWVFPRFGIAAPKNPYWVQPTVPSTIVYSSIEVPTPTDPSQVDSVHAGQETQNDKPEGEPLEAATPTDAWRRHLETQRRELDRCYNELTKRIEALDADLAVELDSERKLVLQERRQRAVTEREEVARQLREIEGQLGITGRMSGL